MKLNPYLLLLLVLTAASVAGAENEPEPYKVHVYGWSYSRERKTITGSNRVTANFNLKNVSEVALDEVKLALTYYTGMGEVVSGPFKRDVGTLKAGEVRKLAIAGEFIPIFNAYTIVLEYKGGKEEWRANSDIGQPDPKSGVLLKGVANVVILGREAGADKFGRFAGTLRVQNEGTVEAKNVKFIVTFYVGDNKKQKLKECSGTLGRGSLAGGMEENIPFAVPDAPRGYTGYEIRVACDDSGADTAATSIEFTNAEDVEFAKIAFKRGKTKNEGVKVTAQVRNGLALPVNNVKLTLVFRGPGKKELKRFPYALPGELKPGEIKPVEFTLPELPDFVAFEPEVAYDRVGAPSKPAAAEAPKFKNLPELEVIFTEAHANSDDKSVSLLGVLRNGRNVAIKDVAVIATFTMPKGDPVQGEKLLTDITQPGETRNFVLKAAGAAGFSSYTFQFNSAEAAPAAPAVPAAQSETPKAEQPPEKQAEPATDNKEKEKVKDSNSEKSALDRAL